ncbi:aldo/keto reductase [Sphingomonas koreensis]|nr:aldo/keto reductase [Sphingomonas koreensis]
MRYNPLGRTGLFVSELCLGTMTFGGEGFFEYMGGLKQDAVDGLMKTAFDAGVNFVDTADVYSNGLSEEFTGQALKNLGIARDQYVLATKFYGAMGEGQNQRGASRYHVIEAAKASMQRLGVDHIDLYQIHGFDPATPIEETLAALDTLVQHGHVRYIGCSNWAAWQVAKATGISERRGFHRFQSLQAYYTLVGRELEREIVPMLASEGLGLMVWSPLAGGYLSGKYQEGEAGRRSERAFPPVDETRGKAVVEAMRTIAAAKSASVAQIALAWLLHQPVVTSVILGAKKPEQLADNLGAVDIVLSKDDLAALDAASALPGEYPGWMLALQSSYRNDVLKQGKRGD